ncbi:MAG: N-acetylmuramoyl-L-alanine amidase family protein [Archangium sp.]
MRFTLATVLVASVAFAGPIVVIDPGHGGNQEGASGSGGLIEKNLALTISKKLKAQLEKELDATVILTRDRDTLVHLSERVTLANAKRPDLFISIHANSMPTEKQRRLNQGIETYFLSASASGEEARKVAARENAESGSQPRGHAGDTLSFILADLQRSENHADSSRLAYSVHEALITETGAQDRGVQQAPFYVLMGLEAPAVLVEVGFVSHPEEGKHLSESEYQAKLARAITAGVKHFLTQVELRDGKKTE